MIRDHATLHHLVETVDRFVKTRLVPLEETVELTDEVPDDVVAEMKAMGLFGLTIPESYGGLGLTAEEEMNVVLALSHTSPAFRSALGTNNGIGSSGLLLQGSEEQKRRYLPGLASGELISSFALTEPGSGSDAASITTSARRDGDFYILNGTKRYITNAPHADVFTVMARTSSDVPGARGISAFVVERGTPGLILGKPDRKMGQRGTHTCDVIFENARVPVSQRIGEEGSGFSLAMRVLDKGRLQIAAVCVGVAERILADALRYAVEREQFGKSIGEFQLIQAMLADSKTEILAGRCLVMETARAFDMNTAAGADTAACKLYTSEMVGRVADRAVQIHGGAGYMAEYAVERFYRDVRLFRLYEGTTQIQQLVIARHLIKDERKRQGLS